MASCEGAEWVGRRGGWRGAAPLSHKGWAGRGSPPAVLTARGASPWRGTPRWAVFHGNGAPSGRWLFPGGGSSAALGYVPAPGWETRLLPAAPSPQGTQCEGRGRGGGPGVRSDAGAGGTAARVGRWLQSVFRSPVPQKPSPLSCFFFLPPQHSSPHTWNDSPAFHHTAVSIETGGWKWKRLLSGAAAEPPTPFPPRRQLTVTHTLPIPRDT